MVQFVESFFDLHTDLCIGFSLLVKHFDVVIADSQFSSTFHDFEILLVPFVL